MDIQKIKLGSSIYDIKDQIARNGFATASLTTTTSSTYHNGEVPFSAIAFYTDSNKTQELGKIPLDQLAIPIIATEALSATEATTNTLTIEDPDTSIVNNVEVTVDANPITNNLHLLFTNHFAELQNGMPAERVTTSTVSLPLGTDGTIALQSDLTSLWAAIDDVNATLGLDGADVTAAIDTFNEIKDFLDAYENSDDLASLLASKLNGISYDESGSAPKLSYTKVAGGTATDVVTLDTTPTNGSKKPITSGAVYTAVNTLMNLPSYGITAADIAAWNAASGGGVTNVSYATSGSGNSQKHLLQKTVGSGSPTSIVELPTARYLDTQANPETLELVLAQSPT